MSCPKSKVVFSNFSCYLPIIRGYPYIYSVLQCFRCRRKMISAYFEDDWRTSYCKEMCDHCKGYSKYHRYGVQKRDKFNFKEALDFWFQTGPKNLQLKSKPQFTKEQAEHIVAFLLSKHFLSVRRGYSLVSTLAYIDTNNDQPFNSKEFGDKILMNYCGILKGVPVHVNNENSNNKSGDNKEKVITTNESDRTKKSEKSTKNSITDNIIVVASSSAIDLTNADSDHGTAKFTLEPTSKRARKNSSSSSEDSSKSSASDLRDFLPDKKKKKD